MIDWIPVSERLPEKGGKYLVTSEIGFLDMHSIYIMSYHDSIGFYLYDRDYGDVPIDSVTAWAPLPEPYKGEEE